MADLEQAIAALVGAEPGAALCAQLKRSEPKIYKDQLAGARSLLRRHVPVAPELVAQLVHRPGLTATMLARYLEASRRAKERGREAEITAPVSRHSAVLDLTAYAALGRSSGQEVTHEPA